MRTNADWAYIQAYKEEVAAIIQQMLEERAGHDGQPAHKQAKRPQIKAASRYIQGLQPGIINTYLTGTFSARA